MQINVNITPRTKLSEVPFGEAVYYEGRVCLKLDKPYFDTTQGLDSYRLVDLKSGELISFGGEEDPIVSIAKFQVTVL